METEFNPWLEMGRLSEKLEVAGRRDLWATLAMQARLKLGGVIDMDILAKESYDMAEAMERARREYGP